MIPIEDKKEIMRGPKLSIYYILDVIIMFNFLPY